MDAEATAALIDEASKKSGLIWVRAAGPGHRAQAVWHLWHDGAAYVLTGGLEQPAPDGLSTPPPGVSRSQPVGEGQQIAEPPQPSSQAYVTVRSKDKRSRLVTFEAAVTTVPPDSDEWSTVVPELLGKRLNLPDGDRAPQRWQRECTLWRLTPTGAVVETPDDPTTTSHAAAPPATPARTRVPRPLHLRGRPRHNRGGR